MNSFRQTLIATLAAVFCFAVLSPALLADVNVINDSGETLFVATGQAVGGRIVYAGWTRIDHGRSANVYAGSDGRIMLSVVSIRSGGPYAWRINNSIAAGDLMACSDDFRCEQLGGALPQWRMLNRTQNSIWVYDQFNPWPSDMNLFLTTFYVVPGNMNQRFVP
jgi:hypothetical protein